MGINNISALALQTGFTTQSSMQHLVSRVSKGLAGVAFSTNTDVKELASLVGFLKDPSKMLASVSSAGPAKVEAKVEKVEEKKEEVVEDVNLGGGDRKSVV